MAIRRGRPANASHLSLAPLIFHRRRWPVDAFHPPIALLLFFLPMRQELGTIDATSMKSARDNFRVKPHLRAGDPPVPVIAGYDQPCRAVRLPTSPHPDRVKPSPVMSGPANEPTGRVK